jgi:hypothetical protein
MPKRDRNFADQLVKWFVFGLLLFFAVYLFHQEYGQPTNPVDQAANQTYQCEDGNKPVWGPYWGLCINLSDTLAQWIMMAFTVIAAGLLYGTLKVANDTSRSAVVAAEAATEANALIRSEQRPWLTIEEFKFSPPKTIMSKTGHVHVSLKFTNVGKSPAIVQSCYVCASAQGKHTRAIQDLRELPRGNRVDFVLPGRRVKEDLLAPVTDFPDLSNSDYIANNNLNDTYVFQIFVRVNYGQAGGGGEFATEASFLLLKKAATGGFIWNVGHGVDGDEQHKPFNERFF